MAIIFGTRHPEIGRCGMAKKLAMLLVSILVLTLVSVSLLAEEPVKFKLIVTDGDTEFLSWCETISIFSFDPTKKVRAKEATANCEPPSDPVKFLLPKGNYEIVVKILGFRVGSATEEQFVIPLGQIALSQDSVFDTRKAKVAPGAVPAFMPSAVLHDVPRQEY